MPRHGLFHEQASLSIVGSPSSTSSTSATAPTSISSPLPLTNERELLFGPRFEHGHAFAKHLGQIVTALNLRAADQTQQERVALGGGDVLELGGIE